MIDDRDNGVIAGTLLFLTGLMTGAVVALLYAPGSGSETREQVGGWLHDKGDRGRGLVGRLREKIPGRISEAKESAETMYRDRRT